MKSYILSYNDFINESFNDDYLIEEDEIFEGEGNAGEAVEGVTGAILLYYGTNKIPNKIPDESELNEIFDVLKNTLGKPGALYQKGDENHWDKPEVIISAFSAALAIQEYLGKDLILNVWRTGRTWPKELKDLGLDTIGGKDYNSSDIVIKNGENKYVGVSLKAKPRITASDPTVINKSLSAVLDKSVSKELSDMMMDFFESICKDALNDLKTLKGSKFVNMKPSYKSLFGKGFKFEMVPAKIVIKYTNKSDDMKAIDFIREIINKNLYNHNNKFYKSIISYLKADVTPSFADTIYDAIFKPKITNFDFSKQNISFTLALVTGIQKLDSKTKRDIDGQKIVKGEVHDYPTMVNVLKSLANKSNKFDISFENHELTDNPEQSEGTTSALYGKLRYGTIVLADLSLRFKGNFTSLSGMAFQASLSKEFKEKLHNTYI